MVRASTLLRYAQLGWEYRNWYSQTYAAIEQTCIRYNWSIADFIQVMAITSPRVHVSRNWKATLHYMHTGEAISGTMGSIRKGLDHWSKTGEIRGRKTKPFADALAGDKDALVLDVWMAYALGVNPLAVTRKYNMEPARRRVEAVAKQLGCTVAQAQAAIWAGAMLRAGHKPRVIGER